MCFVMVSSRPHSTHGSTVPHHGSPWMYYWTVTDILGCWWDVLYRILTELVVVDAFVAGDIGALEPSQRVEDSDNDEDSKHEQPGQGQQVSDTHKLWKPRHTSLLHTEEPPSMLLDLVATKKN